MARSVKHASGPPRRLACGWAAAALLTVTGCTICPDPFDHCGPVPNGSPPHNDFRARSGGIAPLDGAPRPWPPVVQAGPDGASEESRPVVAAAGQPDVAAPAAASAIRSVAAGDSAETDAAETPPTVEPPFADPLPPPVPPHTEISPPLRETPGWRPKD